MINITALTNYTSYLTMREQEMITKASCLDLHEPLLGQLLYLKIVIGILIAIIILFLIMNDKRKRRKS